MSRPTREQVFAALFAKLKTVPGVVTCSRRLQNAQDMQPEQMPAAFQLQGEQNLVFKGSTPPVNTWDATWFLYSYDSDPTTTPTTQLNAMVEAALASLAPLGAFDKQSLGGLVEFAAVTGKIQVFEGVLGNIAIAILPITIVLPGF
jgi:hypothetical protein